VRKSSKSSSLQRNPARRTVGRLLEEFTPADSDERRDARILLSHVLGWRNPMSIDRSSPVSPEQESLFGEFWARRRSGEPAQYILGEWDFFGRTFRVDPRALIPRPETEHLVDEALREASSAMRVLDLGCGSGILAVTIALERPDATVVATDLSPAALALARENARRHNVLGRVRFLGADWLDGIGSARFDLAVSNPPYVSAQERDSLPESVRAFEPPTALFAGSEGLSEIRRLLDELPRVVVPGGAFLFEFGFGQSEAVAGEVRCRRDWQLGRVVSDLASIPRVAVLRRVGLEG
jgi:release factor glutamine methyltransferase